MSVPCASVVPKGLHQQCRLHLQVLYLLASLVQRWISPDCLSAVRAPFWSPLRCRMVEDVQSLSAVQCQVCFLCNLQFIESILPITQLWSPHAHASRTLLTVCISVSNCLSYVCAVRKPQISRHCILSMSLLLIYPNCKIRWSKCNSRLSRSALHATLHY